MEEQNYRYYAEFGNGYIGRFLKRNPELWISRSKIPIIIKIVDHWNVR